MNYKHSLAALAVASVVSGQAMAALTGAENTALSAFAVGAPGTAWTQSIDGTALPNTTVWADGVDECTWYGIVCNGSGDITHVEIPNSGLTDMPGLLTALTPAAGTILTINVSNDAGGTSLNNMPGDMSGLANFTALTHLAINGAGAAGSVPDMSGSTSLNWVNVADSPAITGMGTRLAGGSAITYVNAKGNTAMVGDLTATLSNVDDANIENIHLYGSSGLYGSFQSENTTASAVRVEGSGVYLTGAAATQNATDFGYDANAVVQPVSAVVVNSAGENTATISWTAAAGGSGTGVNVSYTSDDGATLQGTSAASGVDTHNFSGLAAGTYKAAVQATGPGSTFSGVVLSDAFTVTDAVTVTPPTCEEDETLNTETNECEPNEEPVSTGGGGGGAALWLAMLPLMGLLRRKRA